MIQDSIIKMNQVLESKDKLTKDTLYKKLDIGFMEKMDYFKLNSQSFASGKIDLSTSQYIYESLKIWEETTLSERIVIMQIIAELLQKRINQKWL